MAETPQRGHQRMRDGTVAHPALHQLQAPRLRGVLANVARYKRPSAHARWDLCPCSAASTAGAALARRPAQLVRYSAAISACDMGP